MKKNILIVRNEKGSSLILVLIAIVIVSMLGATVLSLSLGNISMANKYKSSSKEYYDMDKIAEDIVKSIDDKLKESQNKALDYMKREKYSQRVLYELKNPCNQGFFNKRWKEKVYNPSLIYAMDKNGEYRKIADNNKYNKNLDGFFQEAFGRLYYNYVLTDCEDIEREIKSKISNEGNNINYKIKTIINKDFGEVSESSIWEEYEPKNNDIKLQIEVEKSSKRLTVLLNITPPVYASVQQEKQIPVRENPLWKNAISFGGTLNIVDPSIKIEKTAAFKDIQNYVDKSVLLNNSEDIGIKETNELNLNESYSGVVYSRGNLTISGNGTFRGSIICEGNVIIKDKPKIYNDEEIIKSILKNKSAVDFFKPGELQGNVLFYILSNGNNARVRTLISNERYKIVEWKESKK